jgi:hypothetical protein
MTSKQKSSKSCLAISTLIKKPETTKKITESKRQLASPFSRSQKSMPLLGCVTPRYQTTTKSKKNAMDSIMKQVPKIQISKGNS